ncbi:hypothetical protein QQF64_030997 [Cirrhinus molitorella]|uniref:Ig-like domain-containing protein n=1 Tax=Cirrhinus molitorella TaxID=172907 RepID=A0ABR3N584_9TELE
MGSSALSLTLLLMSLIHTGFTQDLPKTKLTVDPKSPVFIGETVNLKCVIESDLSDWRYEWYKGQYSIKISQKSDRHTVNRDTLTIRRATESDQGQYWCRGQRDGRPKSSQSSSAVSLSVTDVPSSTLTVTPDSPVFTGETVILKCEIESDHSDWQYEWYKGSTYNSVMLQTSEHYTVNRDSFTIRGATESDQDQYWCKGQRYKRPSSSQESDRINLIINGVSPSVSLVVSPSRSQHFSSDSLSLSCEDQSNSAGWRVRRYTDRNTEDCSKQTGSTCRIVSLSTSDTGVYWCQSESGEKHHPLNITVHDGDVILVSSVDPVIEGDTLTLHCLHRSTNSPILRADFYKDGSLVQNQTTREMSITTVSKSHEGFYYCKTERGQSLHSWISVRVSEHQNPVLNILSFLLAACPYLLATIVLLFKCYRRRVPSAEDQRQYTVTEETT